jgi:hypothetical protein
MKFTVEIALGGILYVIISIKINSGIQKLYIDSGIQKLLKGVHTDTQAAR